MAASESQLVIQVDQRACTAADRFSKLFYEAMDRKRNRVANLYTDAATLVWNGNFVSGSEAIAQFLEKLPDTSHNIQCLNVQAIPEKELGGLEGYLLLINGIVNIDGISRAFGQTITLVKEDELFKISSDRFRFVD